jgi:hypothetical protein
LNRAREGHQRLKWIASLSEALVHREFVSHGVQARPCDNHRLCLAADLALHLRGEVVNHNAHFFTDRVRM